jgi:quercetin dioxygenase-like cupin family protein
MKKFQLTDMVKGWFVGDFSPTIFPSKEIEVAVKEYVCGDVEPLHHHKIATEITVIARGKVRMNGVEYSQGDIILIEPGEATNFEVLEDALTVVVKSPSILNDKYDGAS